MTHSEKLALIKARYEVVKANYKKPLLDIYNLSVPIDTKRKVVQIDTTTGHRVKFDSIADAARSSGSDAGNISKCLKGLTRQCGGYFYRYSDQLDMEVKHQ